MKPVKHVSVNFEIVLGDLSAQDKRLAALAEEAACGCLDEKEGARHFSESNQASPERRR
jgi:hypothetical protein